MGVDDGEVGWACATHADWRIDDSPNYVTTTVAQGSCTCVKACDLRHTFAICPVLVDVTTNDHDQRHSQPQFADVSSWVRRHGRVQRHGELPGCGDFTAF